MNSNIKTDADNWVSGTTNSPYYFRHLLLAYLSASLNSGSCASTYLGKIQTTGADAGTWSDGLSFAMAYDWVYSSLGGTSQGQYRTALYGAMSSCESAYSGSSPYNDVFYISIPCYGDLPAALAVYPDDAVNSLPHLRFAMDLFLNILMPVWRQVVAGSDCLSASTDSAMTCGGSWPESWSDYVVGSAGNGLDTFIVTWPLSWWKATGDPIFTRESWLHNWAYWMMYQVRPDYTIERMRHEKYGYLASENPIGSIQALGEIYNDPTIRGWGKVVKFPYAPTDGSEPSAWPYYSPAPASPINALSVLSPYRDFPGVGYIVLKTGWGEDDTMVTFTYNGGSCCWTRPTQDAGGITLYSRGELLNNSGSYVAATGSQHDMEYYRRSISRNTILINDPSDYYADETYTLTNNTGTVTVPIPNDGGQRRPGSDDANVGGSTLQQISQSPYDMGRWYTAYQMYHQGKLLAFTAGSSNKWAYAAADITAAYNNPYSHNAHTAAWAYNQANTSNRTFRAQKVVRQMLFIPRTHAAYLVVFDQVISSNSSFVVKDVWHTLNSPTVSGQTWTAARSENVTNSGASPWPGGWCGTIIADCTSTTYQYAGKLYAYNTLPASSTVCSVGGAGHEFDVGATENSSCVVTYGTNYNQCVNGYCLTSSNVTATDGILSPLTSYGPIEAGAWRVETTSPTGSQDVWFLHIFLATSSSDTNTVSTVPSTSLASGIYTTTWKDNSDTCTYTVTFPQFGVGATVTASGVGCASTI